MQNREESKNSREIIFNILNDYFKKYCNLKDLINNYLNNSQLSVVNKNFVYNISKGIIRNYLSIDYFISFFSKIKLDKLDFEILNILRLGVFQAVFLTRVPDYSIVNECVEIAKKHSSLSSANFVNAVLRKITSLDNIKAAYSGKIKELRDPIYKISIYYSFPEWVVKYWVEQYRIEKTVKICKALNENPTIYFKINTLKAGKDSIYKEIKSIGSAGMAEYFEGSSFGILSDSQDLLKSDLLKNGFIYIQDLSSQIAVKYFLAPMENETILDVCCAPGGKAVNSSIAINDTGTIIAIDNNKDRLVSIRENIKRMGIKNIKVILADATKKSFLKTGFAEDNYSKDNKINANALKFDKIFIDAPCSALGTSSKNPDAKYNKNPGDIRHLKINSLKMLQNCDEYLKIGGKMVFYTCTLSLFENKNVIENFLSVFKNKYKIEIIDIGQIFNDLTPENSEACNFKSDGFFEIMPYYFKSEGATVCSLIKIA
ncbi:MAG: 16S rRNA (cytosine(967)-C(5))-methyltransferase RsmB [Actinobacteria bacterium]|nr:16S rRNA (cytosine(967)-C(5))-methyltransferase RsmB [Actinomycetota bacterium]